MSKLYGWFRSSRSASALDRPVHYQYSSASINFELASSGEQSDRVVYDGQVK